LGFYFAENGEHTLHEVGKAIAKVLYDVGKGKSENPTTFTPEEMDKYSLVRTGLGTNSRCKAERARELGWKPQKTTQDMLSSVKDEISSII
jgi:nucleoside-diphosphate-sugar epimerase